MLRPIPQPVTKEGSLKCSLMHEFSPQMYNFFAFGKSKSTAVNTRKPPNPQYKPPASESKPPKVRRKAT